MNDILLIFPPLNSHLYVKARQLYSEEEYKWILRLTRVPQGLISIAKYLEQNGYSVDILDCRFHLQDLELEIQRRVSNTSLCVGLGVLTTQINDSIRISEYIKKLNSNLPIIWGGYHPTLYSNQTEEDKAIDYVISGEGEYALLNLANAIKDKKDLSTVKSLYYRNNGNVCINELEKPFDINELGLPAYDLLELDNYLTKRSYNPEEDIKGLEYNGSRGCSYNCAFCINYLLPQQHFWRAKKAEKVIEDITILKDKYKLKYIFFEEELPFVNFKRMKEIAEGLGKLDIRWYANVRVDIAFKNLELLKIARKNGWCETSVGAESGSDKVLKMLNKGITVEQTLKVAEVLNELDVYSLYSFMIQLPNETMDDQNATYRLMRKLQKIHPKSEFIGPQAFRLYPKTKFYEEAKARGEIKEPETLRKWVNSDIVNRYCA